MTGARRLRPYALVGGRTHAEANLSMESMVVASGVQPGDDIGPEQLELLEQCRTPQSLVDLSAGLDVPLGVIRVLLGDLLAYGLITHSGAVEAPAAVPAHRDITLLGELLDGIEAL